MDGNVSMRVFSPFLRVYGKSFRWKRKEIGNRSEMNDATQVVLALTQLIVNYVNKLIIVCYLDK